AEVVGGGPGGGEQGCRAGVHLERDEHAAHAIAVGAVVLLDEPAGAGGGALAAGLVPVPNTATVRSSPVTRPPVSRGAGGAEGPAVSTSVSSAAPISTTVVEPWRRSSTRAKRPPMFRS